MKVKNFSRLIRTGSSAALLSGIGVIVMGASAMAVPISFSPQVFGLVGEPESVTVPAGACSAQIVAFGGAGGSSSEGAPGGLGAGVSATVPVASGQTLTISVGGGGETLDLGAFAPPAGGYGGGGDGGYTVGGHSGGAGGGRTTVDLDSTNIIVAGGGGGGGSSYGTPIAAGGAGGEFGEDGSTGNNPGDGVPGRSGGNGGGGGINQVVANPNGTNGTNAVGPTGGNGGSVVPQPDRDIFGDPHGGIGGGGGGGLIGGGGGAAATTPDTGDTGGGGGGGSSFAPADGQITSGAQAGDGEVTLTFVECPSVSSLELTKSIDEVVDTNQNGVVDPGDSIWYSFDAINTGNTDLTKLGIVDQLLGDTLITCDATTVPAGENVTCKAEGAYVITAADAEAGTVLNAASATAEFDGQSVVSNISEISVSVSKSPAPPTKVDPPAKADPPRKLAATGSDEAIPGLAGGLISVTLGSAAIYFGARGRRFKSIP